MMSDPASYRLLCFPDSALLAHTFTLPEAYTLQVYGRSDQNDAWCLNHELTSC